MAVGNFDNFELQTLAKSETWQSWHYLRCLDWLDRDTTRTRRLSKEIWCSQSHPCSTVCCDICDSELFVLLWLLVSSSPLQTCDWSFKRYFCITSGFPQNCDKVNEQMQHRYQAARLSLFESLKLHMLKSNTCHVQTWFQMPSDDWQKMWELHSLSQTFCSSLKLQNAIRKALGWSCYPTSQGKPCTPIDHIPACESASKHTHIRCMKCI